MAVRRDFYSLQYGPRQVEFGHVCEDPNEWEQRFERKDMDKAHHQGQVLRHLGRHLGGAKMNGLSWVGTFLWAFSVFFLSSGSVLCCFAGE